MWKSRVSEVLALCGIVIFVTTAEQDIPICSELFENQISLLQSPSYPSRQLTKIDCVYVFRGPSCRTHFNLQFLDFNLPSSIECKTSRLEIDGKDILCGNVTGIKHYFSNSGELRIRFVSDDQVSGKGFQILVNRFLCNDEPTVVNNLPSVNEFKFTSTTDNYNVTFCCANEYYAKRFFLTSPGFPHSSGNPNECVYHIYRASNNVCRLRINFLFFWTDEQNSNYVCDKGFLEVDGKYICGCRTGLKLISAFDSRWGNSPKIVRFKSSRYSRGDFDGFALEIIQDECSKHTEPVAAATSPSKRQFNFYDRNNNVAQIQRALLISESQELVDYQDSSVLQHVYFYEVPDDHVYVYNFPTWRDVEETIYTDTSDLKQLREDSSVYKCKIWGESQLQELAQDPLWHQMPHCPLYNGPAVQRRCELADFIHGYIQSVGYPQNYPGNLHTCYRFQGRRGYCGFKLSFVDFDVVNSFECRKDYLLFDGYRYCGNSLHKVDIVIDLRNKRYEDVTFVTRDHSYNRGFRGTYEQISCDPGIPVKPPNPVYPTVPPTPFPPPTIGPPHVPLLPCNRDISDDYFEIEVYSDNQSRCIFNIIRRNQNVCRLSLNFYYFNLICEKEQLIIGNRNYCGRLNQQTLNLNFNGYQLPIIYERSSPNPVATGLRFRISGRQMRRGCDPFEYPEVPSERLLYNPNSQNNSISLNLTKMSVDNSFEDVCGIMMNTTANETISSLCNFLKEHDANIKCIYINPEVIYVPYTSKKDEIQDTLLNVLGSKNFDDIEKVTVNEISCDDIKNLHSN